MPIGSVVPGTPNKANTCSKGKGGGGVATYGSAGSWSSQYQVWLMASTNVSASNGSAVSIWYLSGRRRGTWPVHVNACGPLSAVSGPPHEAMYPRLSFLMMTKALPDCRVPETFPRLIWLAVTSQAGFSDCAVQPSASCPVGPLTYEGVTLTGDERVALTSTGFVARQVVVLLFSSAQSRPTELFPTAEKVILKNPSEG